MPVFPWNFKQLGGDRKTLTLSGLNAPFGRPRKGALVTDTIETRSSKTYYPGNKAPTKLLFGTKLDDIELHGRFSDQANGPGEAAALVETIKQWVEDQQVVQIDWGPLLSIRVTFDRFEPGRESSGEIAWKLKCDVLEDLLATKTRTVRTVRAPKDLAGQVLAALAKIPAIPDRPGLRGNVLDALSNAIDTVTTLSGVFVDAANEIDSFAQATVGNLRRLSGAVRQLGTAVATLRVTIASLENQGDAMFNHNSGDAQVGWSCFARALDVDLLVSQALLAETNRQCEIAERGSQATTYKVRSGDTWESISTSIFGGPAKADVLRQANGARYGQQPAVGAIIHVPLSVKPQTGSTFAATSS